MPTGPYMSRRTGVALLIAERAVGIVWAGLVVALARAAYCTGSQPGDAGRRIKV